MRFSFKNLYEDATYKNCAVMFVTGSYGVFNNIVIDKLRKLCQGTHKIDANSLFMREFMGEKSDNSEAESDEVFISNTVNLEEFITQINAPPVDGKWFCSVHLGTMNKKQQTWLNSYVKQPSHNGVLCLWSTEFRDYKFWLSSKIVLTSQDAHLISLNFPNKKSLETIAKEMFSSRNATISPKALDLFITRMSSSYDDYEKIIDKICSDNLPEGYLTMPADDVPEITYEMALQSMKGIENFVIEDFLEKITEPLTSDMPSGRKKIYHIMGYLLEENGPRRLVSILKSKISELIEFRVAINDGYIPVLVNYDIDEAKKLIGEDNPISKKSDFQFKKLAQLASQTSLNDWVMMKLMLSNVDKNNETSYLKAIYSLVSRSVLQTPEFNEAIGYSNFFNEELEYLDSLMYLDSDELSDCIEYVQNKLGVVSE